MTAKRATQTPITTNAFETALAKHKLKLTRLASEILQINITRLCNQVCVHCHVDASPKRREAMSRDLIERCLELLKTNFSTLDITGGAPELHDDFMFLVTEARQLNKKVIVRHNLTVTLDPHPVSKSSMEYLPEFFATNQVELVSSLPCYLEENTDKQRGDGVFTKSIESLRRLNKVGYGRDPKLVLNLVYNPIDAHLPPDQKTLEAQYKKQLRARFGIEFNNLFAITNMPIHRFKAQLVREKKYRSYMDLLANNFTRTAANAVMCRTTVSVSHDGRLFDCDFNQMLNLAVKDEAGRDLNLKNLQVDTLSQMPITFRDHCFGCTAGAGSSCTGSVS